MGRHEWTQTTAEVTVKFLLESGVGKDKVRVKIETSRLTVSVAGVPVFNEEMSAKVSPDDSYWQIEGNDAGKTLVITLSKRKAADWRTLTRGEEEVLPKTDVLDDGFNVSNLEHDDDDPERVEEQLENEKKLEARYQKLFSEKGLDSEDTLETFFALFDNCIQLYRLNKLSDYLEEVVPACRKRTDKYKLKAIQALSFVRWKQSRFKEALPLFHEMEDIIGKGAALCENIAHTYNSMGDYEKAEDYFRQALRFIESEHGSNRGNRGGVLLGLGLVRDRLGKHAEALPVILKAYEFYKERARGAPASLQAKAGISCAKLHAKLGNLPKAEAFIREAVGMYEVTCGETSPLTASAYHELGKCLWAQRKRHDAQKALQRSYELESMKDAWDLVTLLEIHNLLMDTHLKETTSIDRSRFHLHFKTSEYVVNRVRKDLPQDGNAAVYYKAAAELLAWGGKYAAAKALFNDALPLFECEKSTNCSGLISGCKDMLAFCDRNLDGKQDSPMDFQIPGGADEGDSASSSGIVIEEITENIQEDSNPKATGSVASGSSHSAVQGQHANCVLRPLQAQDWGSVLHVCETTCMEPLLSEAALKAHLSGAGAGLCWAAEQASAGRDLVGLALCGCDGVFCQLLQLVVLDDDGANGDILRGQLVDRCAQACKDRGLRGLRILEPVGSQDDQRFDRLGWTATHRVYSRPSYLEDQQPKNSRPAQGGLASSASSSHSAAPASALRRDGKDVGAYYGAWDSLNVDKALIAEDGGDPSIVPDAKPTREDDFGGRDIQLDVTSRISRFSWDQSDKFVSIYVPFDGVGVLPSESVEVVFRPRGVLLVISTGGKQQWYKIPNLCKDIVVEASKSTVKADQVVLKLRKAAQGLSWSDLSDDKDKYQQRREYRVQHGDLKGATTEELLADMYKNANDEDRAGLRDAMKINREKREEDAKAPSARAA